MADSLNEIFQVANSMPSVGEGLGDSMTKGLQTGMQLARTQQEVELQKQQVQSMKADLEDKKWSSAKGLLNTYMRATPGIRKAMKPKLQQQFQGLGGDPAIIDAMDDEHTQGLVRQALNYDSKDPIQAADGMQAIMSVDAFGNNIQGLVENRAKLRESEQLKELQLASMREMTNARLAAQHDKQAGLDENRANLIHERALKQIEGNKPLQQKLTQIQNLDNAYSTLMTGTITPENFHEYQQSIRSNLGIKGGSVGQERMATYYDGLGIKGVGLGQFLSMTPQDIRQGGGQAFLDHVVSMANNERSQVQRQADKMIDVGTGGRGTFYSKHPELKSDLMDFAKNKKSLYAPEEKPASAAATQPTAPAPTAENADAAKLAKTASDLKEWKYTPEQIKQFLKGQNHTDEEINAAMGAQ